MKCRYCHNEVEADSIFCRFCGERLARVRRQKKKQKPTAPKPRRLESGEWAAQVMIAGRRQWVKGETEADYYARADALKAGVIAAREVHKPLTVGQMVDAYVERSRPVLSPSTIRGYKSLRDTRFQNVMEKDVYSGIDWQLEINAEMRDVKPKTLANAWRLITAAMRDAGVDVPRVKLPQIPKGTRPWLDYEQITDFLVELYESGEDCLVPALLALHGLRRSEVMALTAEDVDLEKEIIHVRGAEVYDDSGARVKKATTKTRSGSRDVPFMIPTLKPELRQIKSGRIVTTEPHVIYDRINGVCDRAGVPRTGWHGLRHSFCSLCWHLGIDMVTTQTLGGWADYRTVQEVYTHLAAADKAAGVETLKKYFSGEL